MVMAGPHSYFVCHSKARVLGPLNRKAATKSTPDGAMKQSPKCSRPSRCHGQVVASCKGYTDDFWTAWKHTGTVSCSLRRSSRCPAAAQFSTMSTAVSPTKAPPKNQRWAKRQIYTDKQFISLSKAGVLFECRRWKNASWS